MKRKRHEKIMELIREYPVETQEDLLSLLRKAGFDVTQATVSRDIKELRLTKTLSSEGRYRYVPAKEETHESAEKFRTLFANSAISVGYAQNIVCVKCQTGMANAVCAAMDSLHWKDMVGTLAGDDTIFILVADDSAAGRLAGELKNMVR